MPRRIRTAVRCTWSVVRCTGLCNSNSEVGSLGAWPWSAALEPLRDGGTGQNTRAASGPAKWVQLQHDRTHGNDNSKAKTRCGLKAGLQRSTITLRPDSERKAGPDVSACFLATDYWQLIMTEQSRIASIGSLDLSRHTASQFPFPPPSCSPCRASACDWAAWSWSSSASRWRWRSPAPC